MKSTKQDVKAAFLELPVEVRQQIHSYALSPCNIHIEPKHYFSFGQENIEIGPPTTGPCEDFSESEPEWLDVGLGHILYHNNTEDQGLYGTQNSATDQPSGCTLIVVCTL